MIPPQKLTIQEVQRAWNDLANEIRSLRENDIDLGGRRRARNSALAIRSDDLITMGQVMDLLKTQRGFIKSQLPVIQGATGGGGSKVTLSDSTPQMVGTAGAAGTSILASRADHIHKDRFSRMARVYHVSDQTINNNTTTVLSFDTERFDNGPAFHDTSSNNSRLTIPVDGVYLVICNIIWKSNSNGSRMLELIVNGGTIIATSLIPPCTGQTTNQIVSTIWNFTASQYVQARVLQDSGGTLDVARFDARSPEFMIAMLGSASVSY